MPEQCDVEFVLGAGSCHNQKIYHEENQGHGQAKNMCEIWGETQSNVNSLNEGNDSEQPVFDGAMPYIWRGEAEDGGEEDPEQRLQIFGNIQYQQY